MDMPMTVLGRIGSDSLGMTHMHEHLYVRATPASERNPALRIDREADSTAELKAFRRAGCVTLVDCQPGLAGRNAQALRRMSADSGVNIICVTGYHLPAFYEDGASVYGVEEEKLYERFLSEITEGIRDEAGAGPVYPGAVKAAIGDEGPVGSFVPCLRAAARAAEAANVPLILHTEYGRGAVEAIALCESVGLEPARIAVCHADRQAADFAPHEAIAQTGAHLEYDTIARPKYHDDESEIRLILHMLSRGWGERLLLSLDSTAARLRAYGGSPGLTYLKDVFLPALFEAGASRAEIQKLMVHNPAHLLN